MRFIGKISVALGLLFLAATGAGAQDVTLSVAVSLKDVTEELGRTFMAAHPGVALRYNLGASGDLQKQIEAGAISLMAECARSYTTVDARWLAPVSAK